MMDQAQIDAIKARRAAVTPGEWECDPDFNIIYHTYVKIQTEIAEVHRAKDAEFIANAPADIDALLAYIEELKLDLAEASEIRYALDGEYSHAHEHYYDIQEKYKAIRESRK
jgi:hypothetical protein